MREQSAPRHRSSDGAYHNHFLCVLRVGNVGLTCCRCGKFCHAANTYAINESREGWKERKYVAECEHSIRRQSERKITCFKFHGGYLSVGVERCVSGGSSMYAVPVEIWSGMKFKVAHKRAYRSLIINSFACILWFVNILRSLGYFNVRAHTLACRRRAGHMRATCDAVFISSGLSVTATSAPTTSLYILFVHRWLNASKREEWVEEKIIITITTTTVITPPWSLNGMWNIYDVHEESMSSAWYLVAFGSWRWVERDELCTPRADESQKEKLNERKEEQHNFQCFRFLSERTKRHRRNEMNIVHARYI